MRRRRNQSIQASLDSLLDTMTNVVGILVIILVLTILGVDEAVSRISEQLADEDQVTQEQYDATLEKVNLTAARLEQVRTQPTPKADLTYERQLLANLQSDLSKLESQLKDDTDPLPNPDALTKQLQDKRKALSSLQNQLKTVTQQSEAIDDKLAAIGQPVQQKPKQVTIPNPRTAPEGAEPVFFLCKGGRVYEVPMEQLFEIAEKRINLLRREHKAERPPCKKIVAYFEANEVASRGIRLKTRVSRNRIYLRFLPDDGLGETIEEMQRSSSRFKRAMLKLKRDKDYARFIVWPDSYEAYLAARTITDDANLPAGWQPMWDSSIFERWTPFVCTPEEPLPPVAKPNPNDPPKPKPLPEPPID